MPECLVALTRELCTYIHTSRCCVLLSRPCACARAGRIPTEIGDLTALTVLCLQENKFIGALLPRVCNQHGAVALSAYMKRPHLENLN